MSTLFHLSKKGFTLIELMIVMSIIGILASALYPSVTGYFQRAKVVEYQTWWAEIVQLAKNYNKEIWALEWPFETSAGEYYYAATGADIANPSRWHQGFSDYITKNNPSIWSKMDKLNPVWHSSINADSWTLYNWKLIFGLTFPWRDMTSSVKSHSVSWYMWGIAPEMWDGESLFLSWSIDANNMPTSANKRCSPGIAWGIENNPGLFYTQCIYFLD
jgi:prepilin-type N-terminal cleavage/methylation domain-containing protein